MLAGRTVLVTGATGFIGGRLVEKLALQHDVRVRALVRNFTKVARLSRLGPKIELIKGTLDDVGAIEPALQGVEVVFHCAHDPVNSESNLRGIRGLGGICARSGVRLVHVSTISVYEPLPDGDLDETSECALSGFPYADNKLAVEREVFHMIREQGLNATILQPTIVYGPYCKPWTLTPAKQLLSGTIVLPDGGEGYCNAVYVDDVCDGLILAAIKEEALGERFLVSGPQPISWRQFYAAFEEALGIEAVQSMSSQDIGRLNRSFINNLKLLIRDPKRAVLWEPARKIAFWVRDHLSPGMKSVAKKAFGTYRKIAPAPIYMPGEQQLALYGAKCAVRIDKARRLLSYDPSFDFTKGMDLTRCYLQWAIPEIRASYRRLT